MSQTKKHSVFEAVSNTAIGYGINFSANLLIFPLFGMHISVRDNFALGLIYTAISIVRGYILRRAFNRLAASRVSGGVAGAVAAGSMSINQARDIANASEGIDKDTPL